MMKTNNISIVTLQGQLYSAICHIKVLSRAYDAMCGDEIDADEVNGLTEGFSEVVDKLQNVSRKLDEFKKPADLNVVTQVVRMRA